MIGLNLLTLGQKRKMNSFFCLDNWVHLIHLIASLGLCGFTFNCFFSYDIISRKLQRAVEAAEVHREPDQWP